MERRDNDTVERATFADWLLLASFAAIAIGVGCSLGWQAGLIAGGVMGVVIAYCWD